MTLDHYPVPFQNKEPVFGFVHHNCNLLGYQTLKNRGPTRILFFGPSIAFLGRAITNLEFAKIIGAVVNPVIRLRRTINISATVDEVYEFLGDFKNYSRFMSYVYEVNINEIGGLRWKILGPGGVPIEWNASLVAMLPGQKVAWKSVPNSIIAAEGSFYLRSTLSDWTQLEIELTYAPPAGALGYAVGHFLGYDPSQKIDEDIRVMKSLIEHG